MGGDAISRREETVFLHKAVHAMADHGFSRNATASALGLSLRSVRRYLLGPCPQWETEKAEAEARRADVARRHPDMKAAPFIVPELEGLTLFQIRTKRLRDAIDERLTEGMKKAEIARQLGISRQALNYHIQGGQLRETE